MTLLEIILLVLVIPLTLVLAFVTGYYYGAKATIEEYRTKINSYVNTLKNANNKSYQLDDNDDNKGFLN